MQAVTRTALALITMWLGACGGGSSPPQGDPGNPPPAQGNAYFPLAAGDRWVYLTTNASSSGFYQVDADASVVVDGQPRTSLTTSTMDGTVTDVMSYDATSAGVTVLPSPGDALSAAVGSYMLFRQPADPGHTFVQIDKTVDSGADLDGDGINDQLGLLSTMQVIEHVALATAAGSFQQTLHLRTTLIRTAIYSRTGDRVSDQVVIHDWYAPQVGLVRSEVVHTFNGQQLSNTTTELVAYRVAGVRGGAAPTTTTIAPDNTRVHDGAVAVTASFSLAMDAESLASGGFSVSTAQGAAVDGSVAVARDGRSATFVPTEGWHSGSYLATISERATDRVGNAATPNTWAFTLDTVAPALALADPADAATGVITGARLSFTFSEPINPASVNGGSAATRVVVTDDTTGTEVPGAITFDGLSTFGFTPAAYWLHDRSYSVTFPAGMADPVGNTLGAAHTVRFTTAASVFGPPQALTATPSRQRHAAFGDVDGDGTTDVIWSGVDSEYPWAVHLYMRRGLADGSWTQPMEVVRAPAYPCGLFSLAVGDTNADGRNDIVLGGSCGIRVLLRDEDGSFSAGPIYQLPSLDHAADIELVHLNADGRLDMLSVGNSAAIRVWHQTNAGVFIETALLQTGLGSLTGLKVGDLDGDTVPDVVTWSVGMQENRLAVLRGLAGGGFDTPQPLGTGDGWPSGVDVADLDGDGRQDIIAAIAHGETPRVLLFRQDPNGRFAAPTSTTLARHPHQVSLLDTDADGRLELLVGHGDTFTVMNALRDGRFGAPDYYWMPVAGGLEASMAAGPRDARGRATIEFNGQLLRPRERQAVGVGKTSALGAAGVVGRVKSLGLDSAHLQRGAGPMRN